MHRSTLRSTSATLSLAGVVLALLTLSGLVAGPAAAAGSAVPWTVETATNHFGADRPNFGYTVNPGSRLEDGIVVVNHGATPLRLRLYAADAFTNGAGRLDLLTRNARSTGVGAWVHPGRDAVTVGPGASVTVPFAIALPANAAAGDHMGGIVTSLRQPGARGAVVERRVGLRIRLRVSGAFEPRLSVQDVHVDYSGGSNPIAKSNADVTYTIRNTGNAILSARQAVAIAGPLGRWAVAAGPIADAPSLLPGEAWKMSVPLRGLTPAGRLTATVTLVPLLTDAAGSVAPLAATKAAADAWTIPWAVLLPAILVLVGLVVTALALRSRRRLGRQDAVEQAPVDREAPSRA